MESAASVVRDELLYVVGDPGPLLRGKTSQDGFDVLGLMVIDLVVAIDESWQQGGQVILWLSQSVIDGLDRPPQFARRQSPDCTVHQRSSHLIIVGAAVAAMPFKFGLPQDCAGESRQLISDNGTGPQLL
jgi:hypothetical protein